MRAPQARPLSLETLVHCVFQTVAANVSRQHDLSFIHIWSTSKLRLYFQPTSIGRFKQYGNWLIMEYSRSYPFTKQSNQIEDEFHNPENEKTVTS